MQRISLSINWGVAKFVFLHQVSEGNLRDSIRTQTQYSLDDENRSVECSRLDTCTCHRVENSIITRVMENARKAVVIRIVVGKTQNLDLLLIPPVVNDTPLKESFVINEDAFVTSTYKHKKQTFDRSLFLYGYYMSRLERIELPIKISQLKKN